MKDNDIHDLCYHWLVKYIVNLVLIIGSAVVIIIVNCLINNLILWLGKYQRYILVFLQ